MIQPTYVDEFTRDISFTPDSTALVVVDMQHASGSREHGLGRLLAERGTLDSAAYRFDRIDQLIVPNTQRLLTCFRSVDALIVYITLGPTLPDYSDAPAHLRKWFEATRNHVGRPEHEIVPALAPQPGDVVLNKTTIGAFGSTAIDSVLRARGIEEIVVTGVSTNNCVGMTAMEAADRQYGAALVSDATGTCSDAMQEATLTSFRRLWGRVATTDEVIAEITGRAASS
ncbi:MAG: isochorismatase family cysteine hydrolase [Pseudomonadota bacterium]